MSNDIVSQSITEIRSFAPVTENGSTAGEAIDTGTLSGIAFYIFGVFVSDGLYALTFEESDTGSGDWTAVPVEKMIGSASIDAEYVPGADYQKVGLFSTKRYIRSVVVASDVTDGVGILAIFSIKRPKITPEPAQ